MPVNEDPLRAMGELAGSVARAMGGPLTAISMVLDRLHARERGPQDAEELKLIQDQLDRMTALAATLRLLAQPARGRPRDLAVNDLVNELAGAMRGPLAAEAISVETSLAPDLPSARGDDQSVREVLESLLYNARLALEDWDGPRKIVIRTGLSPGGRVEICVMDSGPGVPSGDEERIFLPFVSGWGRTGMGLPFSRLALRGQNGELDVEASNAGGACFAIRLPIVALERTQETEKEMER